MLGDGGLAHRERLGQLGHRRLAGREAREDRPPGGIGERGERCVETFGRRHCITSELHNWMVIERAGIVKRPDGMTDSSVGAAPCGRPGWGLRLAGFSSHPGRPHRAAPTETPTVSCVTLLLCP